MQEAEPLRALLFHGGPDLSALRELPINGLSSEGVTEFAGKIPAETTFSALGYFDQQFPQLLREIPDPPLVLFYAGDVRLLTDPGIAIVGARRCTTVGRHLAETLARDIAVQGVHVVSGLALGIDGAAHRGALKASDAGKTIAVLGAGLHTIYPSRHASLARQIVARGGLLLSEYPPGTPPRPFRFPERNRLISGLSIATVVVEACDRSGSLITARLAAEQGRDVLAFPGPVGNLVSKGCHRLIQEGAGLVTNAEEVLASAGLETNVLHARGHTRLVAELDGVAPQPLSKLPLDNPEFTKVLTHIQGYAISFDELSACTQFDSARLAGVLVELELGGFVEQGPLGYIRSS